MQHVNSPSHAVACASSFIMIISNMFNEVQL